MNECPFILLTAGEGPAAFADAALTETDSRRPPPPASAAGFFAPLVNECTFTSTRPWRDSPAARSKAVPGVALGRSPGRSPGRVE